MVPARRASGNAHGAGAGPRGCLRWRLHLPREDSVSASTVPLIESIADLPLYEPPGHSGTRNRRLTDRTFCPGFELVQGEVAPGGEAERHHHRDEHQAMVVLEGQCLVALGDDAPRRCGPGTVVRIPPGLDHHVLNDGDGPLKVMIVYSPPLPAR
jgi:quercetin dioxygenase-like cupin family protein